MWIRFIFVEPYGIKVHLAMSHSHVAFLVSRKSQDIIQKGLTLTNPYK